MLCNTRVLQILHLAFESKERHGLLREAGPLLHQLHLQLVPVHCYTAA